MTEERIAKTTFNNNVEPEIENKYVPDEDVMVEAEDIEVFEKWEQYDLRTEILRGVYAMGFETPSFIQKTAIKPILDGRDIRAQAQSGTGKTGAFAVGALQKVDMSLMETQILIIASTREVAQQNSSKIEQIGDFMNVKVPYVVGGIKISEMASRINAYPQIIVGTPGRVLHMIKDGYLKTNKIKLFIIDEADDMLKEGFIDQVQGIFNSLPTKTVQVAMFSATWEEKEIEVANLVLRNPVKIDLRHDKQTLKGIEQYYVDLGRRPEKGYDLTKKEVLMDIYKSADIGQSVIFVATKSKAKFLYDSLKEDKFPCDVVHSDLTQQERMDVLEKFREGQSRCLVSTGVLARGVDVQQLSVVFNFDLPPIQEKSTYIHRIGRAGRYGKKGVAVNLIYEDEMPVIEDIEKHYQTIISPLPKNFNFK